MNKLFNPFEYYSEKTLITLSAILLVCGSVAAYFFGGRYDGVIDFHLSKNVQAWQPFADNAIATISLVLPLFILAKIINKRTRLIDIVTASLVSRAPFCLEPLFNIGGHFGGATERVTAQYYTNGAAVVPDSADLIIITAFALVSILMLVWFAILLFNGFKTATNIKKTAHIIYFIIAVIVAEIISSIIFYFI